MLLGRVRGADAGRVRDAVAAAAGPASRGAAHRPGGEAGPARPVATPADASGNGRSPAGTTVAVGPQFDETADLRTALHEASSQGRHRRPAAVRPDHGRHAGGGQPDRRHRRVPAGRRPGARDDRGARGGRGREHPAGRAAALRRVPRPAHRAAQPAADHRRARRGGQGACARRGRRGPALRRGRAARRQRVDGPRGRRQAARRGRRAAARHRRRRARWSAGSAATSSWSRCAPRAPRRPSSSRRRCASSCAGR